MRNYTLQIRNINNITKLQPKNKLGIDFSTKRTQFNGDTKQN